MADCENDVWARAVDPKVTTCTRSACRFRCTSVCAAAAAWINGVPVMDCERSMAITIALLAPRLMELVLTLVPFSDTCGKEEGFAERTTSPIIGYDSTSTW